MAVPEDRIIYLATDSDWRDHKGNPPKDRPSIHMPRWASRLTLVVTARKAEWLQMIDNSDARAEGVDCWPDIVLNRATDPFPAQRFRDLWASLHGMESWDANPRVVALTFTVHQQNIDTMGALQKKEGPV